MYLNVRSEIGKLGRVLLHRPGKELERLTPQYLEEMLFEDIPWLNKIREEHDLFADTLRAHGCEVLYYEELLKEILAFPDAREGIVNETLALCRIGSRRLKHVIRELLLSGTAEELAQILITGLSKEEVAQAEGVQARLHEGEGLPRLTSFIKEAYPFYISPLTNFYFTRDPGTVIGNGLSVNAMKTTARLRESVILHFMYKYHPLFSDVPLWYDYTDLDSIEGGDILVLSSSVIAIGCSDRTGTEAIERITERLFRKEGIIKEVLVFRLPFTRAYMHLDTVFTMMDHDTFTIFPGIEKNIDLYRLKPGNNRTIRITPLDNIAEALKKSLNIPAVRFIRSGGTDDLTAAREQWNDSTNTLAIAPGTVITYDRNVASNQMLRESGITVVEIEGSELVRGRGGPRCMSMPLFREPVDS